MKRAKRFLVVLGICALGTAGAVGQEPQSSSTPTEGRQGRGQESGPRPLGGKITAVHEGTIEITRPDGQVVNVKVTPQTEFRKDREPAKASDFKVGDLVMVRGEENPDHSVTARMIGSRSGGSGGPGGGGTLGKDYVVGEVKSVDPPRVTVLRSDNVTQTLELNEGSSLHKGRESITMADIQVGDHVMAHGEAQGDVFVPKGVVVMSPDQWKRMQEMGGTFTIAKPAAPETTSPK